MVWPTTANTNPAEDLYNSEARPTPVLFDSVLVNALMREDPSEPLLPTSHPIESGESISDYVIELPKIVTFDCVFLTDGFGEEGASLENIEQTTGNLPMTYEEKRAEIEGKREQHWLWTINTGYKVYEGYLITDIIPNRTPGNSLSWTVQIVFQHISTVDQQWVSVSLDRIPPAKQSDKLKKGARRGKQKKVAGEGSTVDPKKEAEINALLGELFAK